MLLHVAAQHGVDPCLVTFAPSLEKIQHIRIKTDGDCLFWTWQGHLDPRPVKRPLVGVPFGLNPLCLFAVQSFPVCLSLMPLVACIIEGDACQIHFVHCSSPGVP